MNEDSSSSLDGTLVTPSRRQSKRPLSFFDRMVRAPLGLLWLCAMAIVAVPLVIYMTILYYVVQGVGLLTRVRRRDRTTRNAA